MTQQSLHCEFRQIAKPAGMVASSSMSLTSAYWSTLSINSGNDRTPEQVSGSLGEKIPRV